VWLLVLVHAVVLLKGVQELDEVVRARAEKWVAHVVNAWRLWWVVTNTRALSHTVQHLGMVARMCPMLSVCVSVSRGASRVICTNCVYQWVAGLS
jgi:hypothetical protein